MSKIIAVDFDGVIVADRWPEIGKPFEGTIHLIKELQKRGHKVILWTCRTGEKLEEALLFCMQVGLSFNAVNENLPESIEKFGGDSRKIYADYYIDDKNADVGKMEICIDYLDECSFI